MSGILDSLEKIETLFSVTMHQTAPLMPNLFSLVNSIKHILFWKTIPKSMKVLKSKHNVYWNIWDYLRNGNGFFSKFKNSISSQSDLSFLRQSCVKTIISNGLWISSVRPCTTPSLTNCTQLHRATNLSLEIHLFGC